MGNDLSERADWLARHVLPWEPDLRRQLSFWRLPRGLEADDVVQEAYARLAKLDSVADIRNSKNYFFQVARSIILAHVRRSKIVPMESFSHLDHFEFASDEPTPDIHVSDRQQLRYLMKAISGLTEVSRKALLLRTIHELSYKAIADRLDISENAAQKRVAKSLGELMDILGRGGNRGSGSSSSVKARMSRKQDER